jgi:hypothetical protein
MWLVAFVALVWATRVLGGPSDECGNGDSDCDSVPDSRDNCATFYNPAQIDTDGDLCGNRCDTDYNNDGISTFVDFGQFGLAFGKSTDLEKDHTEPVIGPVGFSDYGVYARSYGKAPGPSGTTPGTIACP